MHEEISDLPVERFSPSGGRRSSDREMWKMVSLVLSLISLAFAAGYNWKGVEGVKDAHDKFVDEVHQNYVLKSNDELQMRNINDRLAEIRDLIQRIELQRRAKE